MSYPDPKFFDELLERALDQSVRRGIVYRTVALYSYASQRGLTRFREYKKVIQLPNGDYLDPNFTTLGYYPSTVNPCWFIETDPVINEVTYIAYHPDLKKPKQRVFFEEVVKAVSRRIAILEIDIGRMVQELGAEAVPLVGLSRADVEKLSCNCLQLNEMEIPIMARKLNFNLQRYVLRYYVLDACMEFLCNVKELSYLTWFTSVTRVYTLRKIYGDEVFSYRKKLFRRFIEGTWEALRNYMRT